MGKTLPSGNEPSAVPDERILSLLLAWFSPAFPVGSFSYSHGLETLLAGGARGERDRAFAAIEATLRWGSGRSDAIFLSHAFRAGESGNGSQLRDVVCMATALAPTAERRAEALNQGSAFMETVKAVWPAPELDDADCAIPYPVAVGISGAAHRIPLSALVQAYLHAFCANLASAAVRLCPLGQVDGQRLVRDLAPMVALVARHAVVAPLEDVGGATIGLDVASMRHEYQNVRLFRS